MSLLTKQCALRAATFSGESRAYLYAIVCCRGLHCRGCCVVGATSQRLVHLVDLLRDRMIGPSLQHRGMRGLVGIFWEAAWGLW